MVVQQQTNSKTMAANANPNLSTVEGQEEREAVAEAEGVVEVLVARNFVAVLKWDEDREEHTVEKRDTLIIINNTLLIT